MRVDPETTKRECEDYRPSHANSQSPVGSFECGAIQELRAGRSGWSVGREEGCGMGEVGRGLASRIGFRSHGKDVGACTDVRGTTDRL